jgi:hypothetical protein
MSSEAAGTGWNEHYLIRSTITSPQQLELLTHEALLDFAKQRLMLFEMVAIVPCWRTPKYNLKQCFIC